MLGHAGRLPVASAALVNGTASHALDFDDVNLAMPGHPSVAILPALLALAEERGSSGADVLTAFVAGYELQCRIGRTIAPGHYDGLGFHATATVGSFGAAAACAHLLGLDARTVRDGAGDRGNAGGRAEIDVRHHVQAAARREGGISRPDGRETGGEGLYQSDRRARMRPGFRPNAQPGFQSRPGVRYASRWMVDRQQSVQVSCLLLHDSCADRGGTQVARTARIRGEPGASGSPSGLEESCDRICNIPAPVTGLEAKFSLRLTTAMGLAGVDTSRLSSYSRGSCRRSASWLVCATRWRWTSEPAFPSTFSEIELLLTDGSRFTAQHDAGIPASDVTQQGKRLEAKFAALVDPVLGTEKTARLIADIGRLDTLPHVRGLLETAGG